MTVSGFLWEIPKKYACIFRYLWNDRSSVRSLYMQLNE